MFATLLAVVVALALGWLARDLSASLRDHRWFVAWLDWLEARLGAAGAWRGRWGLALALLPPLLLVALVQWLLDDLAFGLPGLVFAVAVLFHAWGPRDLDRDVDEIVEAVDGDARRAAASRLWPESRREAASLRPAALVGAVFEAALRRWFGVLFWFLLLGAVGALAYRLLAVLAEDAVAARLPAAMVRGARTVLAVLDWPAAQAATLALALVGNFDAVLGGWRDAGGASLRLDPGFLAAAGRAGVRSELADEAEDYAEAGVPPGSALVLWLVVLALLVIAGWVS